MRDLLAVLGFERGTVVGRSLGGGIAMQFAYLYPEYTERMVLVSSGGLGREVHPLLRAATLPGVGAGAAADRAGLGRSAPARRSARALASSASTSAPTWPRFARGYASLNDAEAREAFLHTLAGRDRRRAASGSAPSTASTSPRRCR